MPPGPKSPQHAALGATIRELREQILVTTRNGAGEAPLSQEALADRAGLHRNYVGAVERGEVNISFANLRLLADALGVRLSEVMRAYEDRAPKTR